MAGVDVEAIEDQMRIAALDGLKGYAQDHYGTVEQNQQTEYITKDMAAGYQILREPAWNKGELDIRMEYIYSWQCNANNTS